jgi:PAS domain S-box-containing protein
VDSALVIRKWFLPVAVFLAVGSLTLVGLLEPAERALMDMRFNLLSRDASQTLTVIQIDSRSLQELDAWPWPRERHGALVDRLRNAGASQVAFIIDFSASTTPESDQAFAQALERANGAVILPTFQQFASPGDRAFVVTETQPLELFRRVTSQGNANIEAGPDGVIRTQRASAFEDGRFEPSMAVQLAAVDGPVFNGSYHIDHSIDIGSIPRHSYADVLNGDFDAGAFADKKVIIGAAALEISDRYGAPNGAILTGPLLQALAYESLVQGRTLQRSPWPINMAGALILAVTFGLYSRKSSWQRSAIVGLAALGAIQGLALGLQAVYPVSLDTATWTGVTVLIFASELIRQIEVQAVEIINERTVNTSRSVLINSVFEGSFDGIIVTDDVGTIQFANAAAAEILGIRDATMAGTSINGILPTPGDDIFNNDLKSVQEGRDHITQHNAPVELALDTTGQREVIIELILSESRLLESRGGSRQPNAPREINVYKLRDITQRKRSEKTIKEATVKALEANRAKSEFLANMSHELRTPLNAIIGFSEIIGTERLGPVGTEKYSEYATDIGDSGHHLLAVINDILDISKVESGTYSLNESICDLGEVLWACEHIIAGTIASQPKQSICEISEDLPPVYADPRLLKQIVLNLLSNAVKFTAPDGRVVLRAFLDDGHRPTIEIEDDGIGIEPHLIPELTKPFYQVAGSLSRTHGGAGLGLALVASHVEMHGGQLEIRSIPDEGTTVTVRLPKSRVRAEAEQPQSGTASASSESLENSDKPNKPRPPMTETV